MHVEFILINRYLKYEIGGDQVLGRILAGLPLDSHEFATLPPHFKNDHPEKYFAHLKAAFPILNSADAENLVPVLAYCLASLVTHYDWLNKNLPDNHPLFQSYLWRNADAVDELKSLLEDPEKSPMTPTGIPAHVSIMRSLRKVDTTLQKIPHELGTEMESRLEAAGVQGAQVTPGMLRRTIEDVMQQNGWQQRNGGDQQQQEGRRRQEGVVEKSWWHYHFYDGKFHRLSKDFKLPKCDVKTGWHLWNEGNKASGVLPLRLVEKGDLATRALRQSYSDWKQVMTYISELGDDAEEGKKIAIGDVTACEEFFNKVSGKIGALATSSKYRTRPNQIHVLSLLRYIRKQRGPRKRNRDEENEGEMSGME